MLLLCFQGQREKRVCACIVFVSASVYSCEVKCLYSCSSQQVQERGVKVCSKCGAGTAAALINAEEVRWEVAHSAINTTQLWGERQLPIWRQRREKKEKDEEIKEECADRNKGRKLEVNGQVNGALQCQHSHLRESESQWGFISVILYGEWENTESLI